MTIFNQFNQLFNSQDKAIATVTGQRGGGVVVAQTLGGATILLEGSIETGKKCFYDRRTGKVLGEAPDVSYGEYGV